MVAPHPRWVNDLLAACSHPLTRRDAPQEARTTRTQLDQFLKAIPQGRDPGDPSRSRLPSYQFWMHWRDDTAAGRAGRRPIRIAGGISLRIGSNYGIEMYYGNFGYHVYPPARGRHFALRACRLLLPVARSHGMSVLWITCNPDNYASRATCQSLGAQLVEIIPVPPQDPLYARGDFEKCRYRLEL